MSIMVLYISTILLERLGWHHFVLAAYLHLQDYISSGTLYIVE